MVNIYKEYLLIKSAINRKVSVRQIQCIREVVTVYPRGDLLNISVRQVQCIREEIAMCPRVDLFTVRSKISVRQMAYIREANGVCQ